MAGRRQDRSHSHAGSRSRQDVVPRARLARTHLPSSVHTQFPHTHRLAHRLLPMHARAPWNPFSSDAAMASPPCLGPPRGASDANNTTTLPSRASRLLGTCWNDDSKRGALSPKSSLSASDTRSPPPHDHHAIHAIHAILPAPPRVDFACAVHVCVCLTGGSGGGDACSGRV
jgi:hypothetical protein